MKIITRFVFAFGLLMLARGCAPAYHCYSGCYVDCKYAARPPLPYVRYEDGRCHSCPATRYLTSLPPAVEEPGSYRVAPP